MSERIYHQEQFHQVLRHRWSGGLDHEDVFLTYVFADLDIYVVIRETVYESLAKRYIQLATDILRQLRMRITAEHSEGVVEVFRDAVEP